MRAVNLIPADQRRGAGGAAGRAGGAVYVLVGALVVLVLMSVLYAISASQLSDRQGKLARVAALADAVQSQAAALQPYVSFATVRQQREQAIASLAAGRFDWAAAMDQIARALPHDVTLTALTGAPPATTQSAPSGPAAAAGPSMALSGCAASHSEVAGVLVALRRIAGVSGVSLGSSQKAGGAKPATGACAATFSATLVYGPSSPTAPHATIPTGATASTATPLSAGPVR